MIPQIAIVIQLAVGLIFFWSSLGKMVHPAEFIRGLAEYGIWRATLAAPLAATLIILEAAVAFAHLTGWMLQLVLLVGACLLGVLAVVVTIALKRREAVTCLCFGGADGEIVSIHTLARLVLLLAAEFLLMTLWLAGVSWSMPYALDGRELLWALLCAAMTLLATSWVFGVPEMIASRTAVSPSSKWDAVRS